MQRNIRLTLAYDGAPFFGWQKTDAGPSIEEALQQVLGQVLQEPVALQAASRTDRGVHAEGQIVNFFTSKNPPNQLSLNRLLPPSLRILEVKEMPSSFHPTLDVQGKSYLYRICYGSMQLPFYRHHSWHVPADLDLNAMREAAVLLVGEHDFSAFCNMHEHLNYTHMQRRLDKIEIRSLDNKRLEIEIYGNHFLYKMARNLVGTLVYVGWGKLSVDAVGEILASKERPKAGITAPAHGLTLRKIFYPD